jgi:hypothetical protein
MCTFDARGVYRAGPRNALWAQASRPAMGVRVRVCAYARTPRTCVRAHAHVGRTRARVHLWVQINVRCGYSHEILLLAAGTAVLVRDVVPLAIEVRVARNEFGNIEGVA